MVAMYGPTNHTASQMNWLATLLWSISVVIPLSILDSRQQHDMN